MTTRTLAQFRAERQLWRKDVAQTLGISEEALEALERAPEVPPEIAQKITSAYNLPSDYFAVDLDAMAAAAVQAQKKAPQNPLAYFYKVSFICWILVGAVQALLTAVESAVLMSGRSAMVANSLVSIMHTAVSITGGVLLCRYISKKTTFAGDIPQIGVALAVLSSYATQCISGLLIFFTPFSFSTAQTGASAWFSETGWALVQYAFLLVQALILPLFSAGILWVASMSESAVRRKKRWMLYGAILVSLTLALVENVLWYQVVPLNSGAVPASGWGLEISLYILNVFVVIVAALGPQELPKLNVLWYTVCPLAITGVTLLHSLLQSIMISLPFIF